MNYELKKRNKDKFRQGFALLFAILASTMLLSISIAILNIALREVVLSSFGRESQVAFYAADSGAECALYWDQRNNAFSTTTSSNINCIGAGTADIQVGGGGDSQPTSHISNPSDPTKYLGLGPNGSSPCVYVSVNKHYAGSTLVTTIRSSGHNTCDTSSPLLVERGLLTSY